MESEAQRLGALEQELRRDLEAIERVKKMMAFKNGAISLSIEAPITFDEPEETGSLGEPSSRSSIKTRSVRWTVQKVVQRLKDTGFELKAQKPGVLCWSSDEEVGRQGTNPVSEKGNRERATHLSGESLKGRKDQWGL